MRVCVCLCSNWGVREGYSVCVCMSVPDCCAVSGVNGQSGLIWQTNRLQGGWGIDVCVCLCLYLCVYLIEQREEKKERKQEVKSA